MVKSKKSKLFDHCSVTTSVDPENNIVDVSVSFKEHMETEPVRVLYSASDVMKAISETGIPVASIVSGTSNQLNNRIVEYRTAEYKFSLLPIEEPAPRKVTTTTVAKPTLRRTKKAKA